MGKKNSNRHRPVDTKRRQLLGHLGLSSLLAAGGLSLPWPMQMAYGSSRPNDYKAAICLFLNGGNDGNDTLIPVDGAFGDYARGHGGLTLPRDELHRLSLRDSDHTLALHPALKNLAEITSRGEVAWIANAGPLVEPVTAADVRNGRARVPSFLGSHPDQQRYVSGGVPGTFAARSGWGGRALEQVPAELVDDLLSNLALNEDNYLMRGNFWMPTQSSNIKWLAGMTLRDVLDGQPSNQYQAYLAASKPQPGLDQLGRAYQRTIGSILDEALELRRVLDRVPDSLAPEPTHDWLLDNGLMHQLRQGVKTLWAGREAGVPRQMIFLDWGGFDTHASQRGKGLEHHDGLLSALDTGLADLDAQLKAGGLHDQVVTMVISEFGRPLRPNSGGGTDHGWGNHFWVMGGPVKGNRLIGQMPTLVPGGPDDMGDDALGRWVPTINSDQIAASVMEWFGLPRSEFGKVFANLENFSSPTLDLF